jgi:hypothetical protein
MAIVAMALWYPINKPKKIEAQTVTANTSNELQPEISRRLLETDSDNDGLKDWEESLWETDAHKADTDGDGTNDGAEVKSNRNPLVKGPKDSLTQSTEVAAAAKASLEPASPTDKIAKELFLKYMEVKQQEGTLDEATQQQLIQSLLENNLTGNFSPDYASFTLKLVPDSTTAATNYGNAVGAILKKYSLANVDNELIILEKSVQTADEKELQKLDIIISTYKKIIPALAQIEVPKGAADVHTDFINSFSKAVKSDEALRNTFNDPASTLTAIGYYQKTVTEMTTAFRALSTYLDEEGVTYHKDEPGYIVLIGL